MRRSLLLAVVMLLAASSLAGAATKSYEASAPFSEVYKTDWGTVWSPEFIYLPQFNPADGTLNSLTVELTGKVWGDMGFTNNAASPITTATLKLDAIVQIGIPTIDMALLDLSVNPVVQVVENNVPGYAVRAYTGLSATSSISEDRLPPSPDLLFFTGTGNVPIQARAEAFSDGSGSGNMMTWFDTYAKATVKITYDYTPDNKVPEMGSLALAGLGGFVGLPFLRRRIK